jgi:hypothetical protein
MSMKNNVAIIIMPYYSTEIIANLTLQRKRPYLENVNTAD